MNITLTPEMQALIDKHVAHGCGASPESVVLRALRALQELEMHDPSPYDQPKVNEPESASVEEERRPRCADDLELARAGQAGPDPPPPTPKGGLHHHPCGQGSLWAIRCGR